MKKSILIITALLISIMCFGQTDGMSYQAVILDQNPQEIPGHDVSGNYLSETEITLRFTITDSNQNTEFQEEQMTLTDEFGMVNLVIGQGFTTAESLAEFDEINWDGTPKWLTVELDYNSSGYQELSHQNLLFVPYAYHRNIIATQTLDVDGASTLNSTLDVGDNTNIDGFLVVTQSAEVGQDLEVGGSAAVGSDIGVGGSAEIGGSADIGSDLTVNGNTQLDQNITAEGIAVFNASFNVMNQSPSYFSGNLTADGAADLNSTLDVAGTSCLNDQVTIKSQETGGQSSYDAYPLRVEGSDQGIAIKINPGTPDATNNYISFFDGNGNVIGRIEGQTADDLQSSATYIYDTAFNLAAEIAAGVNLVLASTGATVCIGFGPVACPPSWSEIAVATANLVLATANYTAYQIFAYEYLGVTYLSASADYAEYLERINHSELMSAGDIVGVTGGKVSLDISNSNQILVISTKPGVLGNMPEDSDEVNYEKVAFMGQVPVKVSGDVEVGDYIIPSGKNDGVGIGVSPEEITPEQYSKIVGIAWTAAKDNGLVQKVNLSIGLNSNDIAELVAEQQNEINALQSKFSELEKRILALENGEEYNSITHGTDAEILQDLVEKEKDIRNGVYDTYETPDTISEEFVKEVIELIKELALENGVIIEDDYVLNKLVNDADFQKQIINETIQNYTYAVNSQLIK